jgi:hypothetical protein
MGMYPITYQSRKQLCIEVDKTSKMVHIGSTIKATAKQTTYGVNSIALEGDNATKCKGGQCSPSASLKSSEVNVWVENKRVVRVLDKTSHNTGMVVTGASRMIIGEANKGEIRFNCSDKKGKINFKPRSGHMIYINCGTAYGDAKHDPHAGKEHQAHHILTNKRKKGRRYTEKFKMITKKYGLHLNQPWNLISMPHKGSHPKRYHDMVLREIEKIDRKIKKEKLKKPQLSKEEQQSIFVLEFQKTRELVIKNPAILNREYY